MLALALTRLGDVLLLASQRLLRTGRLHIFRAFRILRRCLQHVLPLHVRLGLRRNEAQRDASLKGGAVEVQHSVV